MGVSSYFLVKWRDILLVSSFFRCSFGSNSKGKKKSDSSGCGGAVGSRRRKRSKGRKIEKIRKEKGQPQTYIYMREATIIFHFT